jgi:hypothetical protein
MKTTKNRMKIPEMQNSKKRIFPTLRHRVEEFKVRLSNREVIVSYAFCVYCRRRQVSRVRAYNVESLVDQYRRLR